MACLSLIQGSARDRLFLALGTIEGRTARLHDALDGAAATASAAFLAFAVIDGEDLLERALVALRVDEVAQGRSARRDRFDQHGPDMVHQVLEPGIICGLFDQAS